MLQIGKFSLTNPLVLAPMAGITDRPFRLLCLKLGAGLTVGEMLSSDTDLWNTDKSRWRLPQANDPEPRMVQIAGNCPQQMAAAAVANVELGAQIIDINMGCPAKKVCQKAAGSALLQDEPLVAEILQTVVKAVKVPVTLKMRTGWSPQQKNAVRIALIAQDAGIQALSLHGRTRADRFQGQAEHVTLAQVCQAVAIPVIANGDINCPQQAQQLLANTGAKGIMLGRSTYGRPWIFRQFKTWLESGQLIDEPKPCQQLDLIRQHLQGIYSHYGDFMGPRVARKHLGWYLNNAGLNTWRRLMLQQTSPETQLEVIETAYASLNN